MALRKTVWVSIVITIMNAVLSFGPVAMAAGSNVPATMTTMIDQIKGLEAKIPPLQAAVNRINFGPFNFEGSCNYDPEWYCFGCDAKTEHWTYKPNFGVGKAVVQQAYGNLNTVAGTFTTRFSATKTFMLDNILAISEAFGVADRAVNRSLIKYNNAANGSLIQRSMEASIKDQINTLLTKLASAKSDLTVAVAGVSLFEQRLTAASTEITNAEDHVNSMIEEAESGVKNYPFKCGELQCMADLQVVVAYMKTQLEAVGFAVKAAVDAAALNNAVSSMLGSLVSLQQQTNGVLQNLNNAKITLPGAVQKLRLSVAQQSWQQLAAYAKKEL